MEGKDVASEILAKEVVKYQDTFGVDKFKKGWFSELGIITGDLAKCIKIKKILFHEKSKYQDILIFESTVYGRVLVIDDFIQLTENDAFVYEEMAAFLPLNSHPNPKKVLVIGGGDGGLIQEITKHPLVESIILCEIDELVIDACKKYLPFMADGFESPKLQIHIEDGAEYIRKHKGEFDVIINDAPDPSGPALCLYKKEYYKSLKEALKPGGILMSQGFVFWIDVPIIKEIFDLAVPLFPVVKYATSYIGSYQGGTLGYVLCSTSPNTNFRDPIHKFSIMQLKEMGLKYYTPDVHQASMALPLFLSEKLGLKTEIS